MPVIKITASGVILACIITLITPESPLNAGMAVILLPLAVIRLSSGIKMKNLFYANIPVLLFTGSFSAFIILSSFIESSSTDPLFILSFALKTVLIFNLLRLTIAWLGTPGLLWIISLIPWRGVQVYILLFFRGVSHFRRINSLVIHQIKSRINVSSREKYLVPRYYSYNIMMKEINMLAYYEASLASRSGQIPACYSAPLRESFAGAAIILLSLPAWIMLL